MRKTVLSISLFVTLFLLSLLSEGRNASATEILGEIGHAPSKMLTKKTDSCTERCHVNYMAYENKFKSLKKDEIFKHRSHSFKQDMDCISCHDDSEVNTEGHCKISNQNKKSSKMPP